MKKILIAGGTGLIGTRLSEKLRERGYEVRHLSRTRNVSADFPAYKWNVGTGFIEDDALVGNPAVINLAGASIIDKKWTDKRKKMLIQSRVDSAAVFARYIIEGDFLPPSYISASAIGFYGHRPHDGLLKENAGRGEGFLADCTVAWEKAISQLAKLDIRTVGLRLGVVLTTKGGALAKMMTPYRWGVGNWFGEGYYSWIHIDDVCDMFIHALEHSEMSGFYNAVSPHSCTRKEMAYAIQKAKGKNNMMVNVPPSIIRGLLGERSAVMLESARVSAEKIEQTGFSFSFPKIVGAMENILREE